MYHLFRLMQYSESLSLASHVQLGKAGKVNTVILRILSNNTLERLEPKER